MELCFSKNMRNLNTAHTSGRSQGEIRAQNYLSLWGHGTTMFLYVCPENHIGIYSHEASAVAPHAATTTTGTGARRVQLDVWTSPREFLWRLMCLLSMTEVLMRKSSIHINICIYIDIYIYIIVFLADKTIKIERVPAKLPDSSSPFGNWNVLAIEFKY